MKYLPISCKRLFVVRIDVLHTQPIMNIRLEIKMDTKEKGGRGCVNESEDGAKDDGGGPMRSATLRPLEFPVPVLIPHVLLPRPLSMRPARASYSERPGQPEPRRHKGGSEECVEADVVLSGSLEGGAGPTPLTRGMTALEKEMRKGVCDGDGEGKDSAEDY